LYILVLYTVFLHPVKSSLDSGAIPFLPEPGHIKVCCCAKVVLRRGVFLVIEVPILNIRVTVAFLERAGCTVIGRAVGLVA
jgi:hypothetical protein